MKTVIDSYITGWQVLSTSSVGNRATFNIVATDTGSANNSTVNSSHASFNVTDGGSNGSNGSGAIVDSHYIEFFSKGYNSADKYMLRVDHDNSNRNGLDILMKAYKESVPKNSYLTVRDAIKSSLPENALKPAGLKDNEKSDVADAAQEALGQLKPGLSPKDNGTYRVNYFYFGDLVNMCFHLLRKGFGETPGNPEFNNSAAGKVGFMLGPIILPNPCDPTQPGTTINIGDIPISVNLFTAWFTKKVIRPQRTRYLVRNFINDAIGELIPAALGDRCVDEAGRALLRVDTIPVSLKSTNNSTPPVKKGSSVQPNRLAELSSNLDYSSDGGRQC